MRLMEKQGYEIKQGRFVPFRVPVQERFTKCKTLDEARTEVATLYGKRDKALKFSRKSCN